MLCANTLVGGDPALPWSKPAGGGAATVHGSWMALRQGEACHVALLWRALAYAIWVMCISANPRSASLLVLRKSLPPMLYEGEGQRVAACCSREKEAVTARARREAIGRFAPLQQMSKHLSVPASIRRFLIYLDKGKASAVDSL